MYVHFVISFGCIQKSRKAKPAGKTIRKSQWMKCQSEDETTTYVETTLRKPEEKKTAKNIWAPVWRDV